MAYMPELQFYRYIITDTACVHCV